MAERSVQAARKAIDRRNAYAQRVARLEDQLYEARERLRQAEARAWAALPKDAQIRLGREEPWELRL